MRTLVAMSGGVDSSIAAHMMVETYGFNNVWGVHMLLNETPVKACNTKSKSCCGTADAEDALAVAQQLGIRFDAIPMYKAFQKAVINNFTSEYAAGRTPVPCTHCNGKLKFDLLFKYADAAGYDAIATGHYVFRDSGHRLWTAACLEKDQTYYLWQIKQQYLSRLRFPLGSIVSKQQTRDLAEKLGFVTHAKPDSQNICFIRNNYRETLQQLAPETFSPRQGIIDLQGESIGTHWGYWNYTVGQRIGLSGWPQKLYVKSIDAVNNIVYATAVAADAFVTDFSIQDPNWHHNRDPNGEYWIKTGSHSTPVKAILSGTRVTATQPLRATPGQSCVFYTRYDSQFLLEGGAWISSQSPHGDWLIGCFAYMLPSSSGQDARFSSW